MENKNTIIAIVLMLAVWVGFSIFFPQAPVTPSPSKSESGSGSLEGPGKNSLSSSAGVSVPVEEVSPRKLPSTPLVEERDIVVETDLFTAVLSNVGGRLKSFTLKHFHSTTDPKSPLVSLVGNLPVRQGSLRTSGIDGLVLFREAVYQCESPPEVKLGENDSTKIVFISYGGSGNRVEKTFTFYRKSYVFDLSVKIVNQGETSINGGFTVTLVHPWDASKGGDRFDHVGPISLVGEKLHSEKVDDLATSPSVYGKDTIWSGFEDKYFLGAAIPLEGAAEKIRIDRVGDYIENSMESPVFSLQPGTSRTFNYQLYFGPRDLDILKAADHQLSKAIDFGFFSLLAIPLLHILKFFYSFVGNFGVAIIVLTVIIKLLFWPLTQKSYSSMKAMQRLQPEMAKIREKFKNDRERLNREMMGLYKEHRVNPLGGCLPMVVQIPVFFALYKVLLNSIELRHAPFALWLTDLSTKDPYYITPLVMGATMFIQQKMTPSTMDLTQAKIFMFMPIIFTFLFLNFPSGLVIYWLVNNLLTILQQYFINRKPA